MALVKVIQKGDELTFDLSKLPELQRKTISISLAERAGQAAVLVIRADRAIKIEHIRYQRIHND
jgi:hypothetical protein